MKTKASKASKPQKKSGGLHEARTTGPDKLPSCVQNTRPLNPENVALIAALLSGGTVVVGKLGVRDPHLRKAILLIGDAQLEIDRFFEEGGQDLLLAHTQAVLVEDSNVEALGSIDQLPGGQEALGRLIAYQLSGNLAGSCTTHAAMKGTVKTVRGKATKPMPYPWRESVALSLLVGTHDKAIRQKRLKAAGWKTDEFKDSEKREVSSDADIVSLARRVLPTLRPPPKRPRDKQSKKFMSKVPPHRQDGTWKKRT